MKSKETGITIRVDNSTIEFYIAVAKLAGVKVPDVVKVVLALTVMGKK